MKQFNELSRRSVLVASAASIPAIAWAADKASPASASASRPSDASVRYGSKRVGDVDVFYREAGSPDLPVLLLLHGFPTSGHMFRNLIPLLSDSYHVIAPDLPGFGNTKAPARSSFEYSFDHLAEVMEGFVDAMNLTRYAIYVFDYGAPTGLRLAMKRPQQVSAIISQNGNAYVEGLSAEWEPWQRYWRDPSAANREACRASLTDEAILTQYQHGAPAALVSPDGYSLDQFYMRRPQAEEVQLDLILSYRTNVALYPQFQAYFREFQPPLLAVWGRNDPFFIPPGAEAFRRDLPRAEVQFLDAGHFALETHYVEIAALMREFLKKHAA